MCPLLSHKSSGRMGSGSQAVPMTMVPWDLEAPTAFEGPLTWPLGQGGDWPIPGLKRTGILHAIRPL